MAGFEIAGPASLGQVARSFRLGKFAPLYLAGIALGAGLGIGLNVLTTSGTGEAGHAPVTVPSLSAPPVVSESGAPASAPDAQIVVSPATNDLPVTALGFDIWGDPSQAPGTAYVAPASAPAPAAPSEATPVAPAQPAPAVAAPQASAPVAPKPVVQQPAPAAAPAQASKPNFYLPEAVTGPATPLEQRLLDDINAERAKAGLPAYTYDAGLTKIARMRSRQLVDQNYFGHVDPYGYSMYTELLAYFGYSYAWAGENLAMNNSPVERSPEVATNGLMNSPTHRANLLANDFFRIGIGEVTTADGKHYYTMIFLG